MNMKKVILIRCLFGGPIGLLICHVITIVISMSINDGSFYAVVPELISICRNEINAVILQTIFAFLYGAICAGISVIWEIDEWSIIKQSIIHFSILSIVTFPIAYTMRWMEHSFAGVLSYFIIFISIYIGIWIYKYFTIRKKIRQMNEKVKENSGQINN